MQEQGKSVFGLDANVAAGMAYLPVCMINLVISIGVLATDKTNKLPRFHAIQSLLLSASVIAAYIVCMILIVLFVFVGAALKLPELSFLGFFGWALFMALALGAFAGLVVSMIKAFQGEIFKLPVIGNLADQWSN